MAHIRISLRITTSAVGGILYPLTIISALPLAEVKCLKRSSSGAELGQDVCCLR